MTVVRGGKAFAAEQKIRELKNRIAKLSTLKMKVLPTTIILQSAENMNNVKTEKYSASPNEIEQKLLSSEKFRTIFNFHRIDWSKKTQDRIDRYDRQKYAAKERKLRKHLDIGEKVLALAKRIKKKSAPGKQFRIFLNSTKKKYLQ